MFLLTFIIILVGYVGCAPTPTPTSTESTRMLNHYLFILHILLEENTK